MGLFDQAQQLGEQALQEAAPHEVDAHQNFLSEALGLLGQRGGDPQQVTQQAGAENTAPNDMNPSQLVQTTLQLARQHPEIVQEVAQRFPQAQSILNSILGGGGQQSGEGGLGGLLGGLFKG